MNDHARALLTRITERPLMVAPLGVDSIGSDIEAFTRHDAFEGWLAEQTQVNAGRETDAEFFADGQYGRPYSVVDGVLQVPVMGTLLNRFSRQFGTYVTGYQYIERAVARGMEDPAVKGIALVVDSNGGQAAGAFELTDKLYEHRGTKPIRAFVSDRALSAAYAIASAADQVIVTRTGSTGSIGVVAMHMSLEKALEMNGLEVTFIFAGKHKVDGNRFQNLPDSVKAQFQERIDRTYEVFTSTVARNRKISQDAVQDTEALTYESAESVELGLADKVGALDEEMIAFTEELGHYQRNREGNMNAKTDTIPEGYVSPQDHAAAVAKAGTDAVASDRTRTSAVMSHEAYPGREALAAKLLETSEMTAEAITAVLATAPAPAVGLTDAEKTAAAGKAAQAAATAAAGGGDQFTKHMDKDTHPNAGADTQGGGGDEPPSTGILAAYVAAGGAVVDRTKSN